MQDTERRLLSEVMTRGVEVVGPETSIQEAARQMDELNVGALPVCDGERLLGMVTDRDITVRATSVGKVPGTTPVREAMTAGVAYCYADQPVSEAARLMQEQQIRRLPIVDRNKRLVGIVSLGDLAVGTGDDRLSGQVLEGVSEPAEPDR